MRRRFKPAWTAEKIPGGFVVNDATGQSLAYVYGRHNKADVEMAKVLTGPAGCGQSPSSRAARQAEARSRKANTMKDAELSDV